MPVVEAEPVVEGSKIVEVLLRIRHSLHMLAVADRGSMAVAAGRSLRMGRIDRSVAAAAAVADEARRAVVVLVGTRKLPDWDCSLPVDFQTC